MSVVALSKPVFPAWNATHSAVWGHQPIRVEHGLHETPLFSMEAIEALVERYPREHYSLIHMGARDERRFWREGDIGSLSGRAVIEAIGRGRMWLNLRNLSGVDARYRDLLDSVFADLERRVPGLEAPNRSAGLLISSPDAQVYYHADLPQQVLWQLHGRKRVHVYPTTPPFITREQLEDIALFDIEVDLPYQPWYDEHALAFVLEPGQMLTWPHYAPHRVENLGTLNISLTVSYGNEAIRRMQVVKLANGLLRHRFGLSPKAEAISGPGYWAKAALQKALRDGAWVKRERARRRPIEFTLDASRPGEIVELKAA
jgi:hypothetical protein